MLTDHAATDDHHLCWWHTWHPTDQQTRATVRCLEEVGSGLYRHSTSNLRHWSQQWQAPRIIGHRLVCNAGRATGDEIFRLVRIGREADNDICLTEKTVHRYHAVIRRSSDGEVIVTDLSGPEGNGVIVNGARVGESRLKSGDVIAIGEVKLSFDARPI